jgi:hypothetical protein
MSMYVLIEAVLNSYMSLDMLIKQNRPVMDTLVKRGRGRPKKGEIVEKKKPGTLGRPKGEASVIAEYRARMLASPKSKLVLDKIYEAALDDEHKNQSAAWKLLMERLLPISHFEKDKDGGGRPSVSITITGVGGETTIVGEASDVDDVTYRELDNG